LINSRGLQIYPHVPRIGKMGSSQSLDSRLVMQTDIQQCDVEVYFLIKLDW